MSEIIRSNRIAVEHIHVLDRMVAHNPSIQVIITVGTSLPVSGTLCTFDTLNGTVVFEKHNDQDDVMEQFVTFGPIETVRNSLDQPVYSCVAMLAGCDVAPFNDDFRRCVIGGIWTVEITDTNEVFDVEILDWDVNTNAWFAYDLKRKNYVRLIGMSMPKYDEQVNNVMLTFAHVQYNTKRPVDNTNKVGGLLAHYHDTASVLAIAEKLQAIHGPFTMYNVTIEGKPEFSFDTKLLCNIRDALVPTSFRYFFNPGNGKTYAFTPWMIKILAWNEAEDEIDIILDPTYDPDECKTQFAARA